MQCCDSPAATGLPQAQTQRAAENGWSCAHRAGKSQADRHVGPKQPRCAGVSNTSPLEKTSKSSGSPSWYYQLRTWKQAGRKPALSEPRDQGMHPINCTMLYLETASLTFFKPFHSVPSIALAETSLPCQKQCFPLRSLGSLKTPEQRWGWKRKARRGKGIQSPGGCLLPRGALARCPVLFTGVWLLSPANLPAPRCLQQLCGCMLLRQTLDQSGNKARPCP